MRLKILYPMVSISQNRPIWHIRLSKKKLQHSELEQRQNAHKQSLGKEKKKGVTRHCQAALGGRAGDKSMSNKHSASNMSAAQREGYKARF